METKIISLLVLLIGLISHSTCFDDRSIKMFTVSRGSLIKALREAGGGPLGAFNKNYMAFTRQGTIRFTDLSTIGDESESESSRPSMDHQSFTRPLMDEQSSSAKRAVRYPMTTRRGTCDTRTNGHLRRMCAACPATTDLGPGRIPRYINEVLCDTKGQMKMCSSGKGLCGSSEVKQQFLRITRKPSSTSLKLGPVFVERYTQNIRVSCQCLMFTR